jgi:hypothetical protein
MTRHETYFTCCTGADVNSTPHEGGKITMKNMMRLFLIVMLFFLTAGCAALVIGGAAVGTGSGTYFYINGELINDYGFPFDNVWAACEKTMADSRVVNVQKTKEIGSGSISAVINDERVEFTVKYKEKNVSTVAVRVGLFGDKAASKNLHDKIAGNISKN